jgi:predicted ATP-grasp superfamily ATP-dependent carboligase
MRRRPTRLDALLLDADERQMLVATRSLGRAGLTVGAADSAAHPPAARSRWCRLSAALPDAAAGRDVRARAVVGLLRDVPADVLMCGGDATIEAIRARRGEIEALTAPALAAEPALAVAVSKPLTLALARDLCIATPRGIEVSGPGDAAAALSETGLPAVVKPARSWVGAEGDETRVAPVAVVDAGEAAAAVAALAAAGETAVLQEWIPGRREAVSLVHARGRVWARFAQVALTMLPSLGGSSVLRESIRLPPDAADAAERLVRAMGLEGYAEVEFRRARDGRPVLMEVNPRLSASVECAVRAGVDFPLLLHRWASGAPLAASPGYRVGVRMRWLGGDLRRLAESVERRGRPDVRPIGRALGAFLADFLRPAGYDYVALDDPAPMVRAALTSLGGWPSQLGRLLPSRRAASP